MRIHLWTEFQANFSTAETREAAVDRVRIYLWMEFQANFGRMRIWQGSRREHVFGMPGCEAYNQSSIGLSSACKWRTDATSLPQRDLCHMGRFAHEAHCSYSSIS